MALASSRSQHSTWQDKEDRTHKNQKEGSSRCSYGRNEIRSDSPGRTNRGTAPERLPRCEVRRRVAVLAFVGGSANRTSTIRNPKAKFIQDWSAGGEEVSISRQPSL